MLDKIKGNPGKILEPSAGKGDIIDGLTDRYDYHYAYRKENVSAIEIDKTLRATLRGKGIKVVDTNFLTYSGSDQYDLIIANPPFNDGDKHLLKAIDIMYCGEIVFLLNADTVRNPYTNTRKDLIQRLNKLNVDIEYIQGAFKNAERPTGVEVALIYINIERKIEDDLFNGCDDSSNVEEPEIKKEHEVSTGKTVEELVAEYNQIIEIGIDTIMAYYENYQKIGSYIGLNKDAEKYSSKNGDMTSLAKEQINDLLNSVRHAFWRKTLNIPEVQSRMTTNKQSEFEGKISKRCFMDFTENNIRRFILNLISGFEQTLIEAVLEVFDLFTRHGYMGKGVYEENIHYYNGWKTNDAFKVKNKVIIPIYGGWGKGPFVDDYSGAWKLSSYDVERKVRDIDIVMSYFDGMPGYLSITAALGASLAKQQSRNIVSTYFTMTAYKKGTLHLTFNNEDILRRFNIVACKGKGWLPGDYGTKPYQDMVNEERGIVDSFEGEKSYSENLNKSLFADKALLRITT